MSKETNVVGEIKNLMVKFGFMSAEDKDDFAKLADGTEIRVEGDELKEGAAIFVVTEEGDVPAPDGVHILEDGSEVRTEGGIVAEIKVAEEAEEEEVKEEVEVEAGEHGDEEKKEDMEEEIKEEVKEEIVEKLEEIEDEKEEVEMEEEVKDEAAEKIVEVIVPILEKVKDLEEELKKVQASFEAFRNEPAGKPVNKTKKEFSHIDSTVEKILSLRKTK